LSFAATPDQPIDAIANGQNRKASASDGAGCAVDGPAMRATISPVRPTAFMMDFMISDVSNRCAKESHDEESDTKL
jgi:hypothetical protein